MKNWNSKFRNKKYIYGKEPNVFLKEFQKKIDISGNALAIAEGEGRNAIYLAEQGMQVTTWDFAESGLEKTKMLAKEKGVEVFTELVDLNEAKWNDSTWDEIICIYGHFSTKLRYKTLEGVKRAIRPGGFFLTEVYSPYQISYKTGGPHNIDFLYKAEEFLETFSDWRIVHLFLGEVIRQEGELHNGLSHVIQFVGQKPEQANHKKRE